jgi:diguanylate cyclase (GGDEF)-like protein/PAS domain S-box-containing protein
MQLAGAFRHTDSIVAILSVDDGTFVDVNPAFERVVGWRREEALGKRTIDLHLWPDFQLRATIWAHLRSSSAIRDFEVRFQSKDGSIRAGRLDCELMDGERGVVVFCLLRGYGEPSTAIPTVADDRTESYRALFQSAAEGIYRSLPNGGFIDVNPAMARIFGFESPAAMLTQLQCPARELYVDPAHGAAVLARLDAEGRIDLVESEVQRRDGSRIWISENARAVRDETGSLLFYEGTVIDITERRGAEAAVRQSEALYKVLVDNCRDGVFLVQRGQVVFANRALAAILGYQEHELIGKPYFDLISPGDRAAQAVRRSAREAGSQEVQRYEVNMLHRDGHYVLCAVHADAVHYKGDIASTGIIRDVTEERRQHAALEQAERRYREIFERSPAGLFRTALDGRILEANPQLARILGFDSPDALKRERASMAEVYADPGERQRLVARVLEDGGLDNYETQILRRDGSRIWVATSVRLLQPVEGGEPQFAGSVLDLSARRHAEHALQREESKYRTLVEHSQVGVFISRGEQYVYVNQRLCEMLGYSEQELLALNINDLVAPEYLPATEDRLRRADQGEALAPDFESCYVCKDGSRIWVTVSLGPMDIDGEHHLTGTMRDVTRHREAEHRLRFHATHDALTGLPNRMLFQRRLDDVLREARDSGAHDYAVLFLDLDGFKLVNDSLGHAAGDRLLVVIGELLTRTLSEDALVARYGGDEFTILPYGPCSQARAVRLAERILELFAAPFDIDSHQAFSGASLGIVLGHEDYSKPDQVLRDADTAMYRAKAGGKSGYVIFDEAMHAAARQRFQLETDFRLAFERDEFRVYYQPVVSLQGGALTGFEALVRWQHPQRGLLAPGEFLHVAEESGLIAQLDWWVLEQACRQVAQWQRQFPERAGIGVSVNVDERQISARDVEARLHEVLRVSGIAIDSVTLEVTETVFRSGRGPATPMLQALKGLGVGLAVDDFGTGYSSLDSFASAPFDTLKIDQSFIRDMESNPRHRAIVRTISGFAEDLGLSLTAEGVETQGQARLLAAMGCHTAQGYLYSPPLPAHEAEKLLGYGILAPRAVGYG